MDGKKYSLSIQLSITLFTALYNVWPPWISLCSLFRHQGWSGRGSGVVVMVIVKT